MSNEKQANVPWPQIGADRCVPVAEMAAGAWADTVIATVKWLPEYQEIKSWAKEFLMQRQHEREYAAELVWFLAIMGDGVVMDDDNNELDLEDTYRRWKAHRLKYGLPGGWNFRAKMANASGVRGR